MCFIFIFNRMRFIYSLYFRYTDYNYMLSVDSCIIQYIQSLIYFSLCFSWYIYKERILIIHYEDISSLSDSTIIIPALSKSLYTIVSREKTHERGNCANLVILKTTLRILFLIKNIYKDFYFRLWYFFSWIFNFIS